MRHIKILTKKHMPEFGHRSDLQVVGYCTHNYCEGQYDSAYCDDTSTDICYTYDGAACTVQATDECNYDMGPGACHYGSDDYCGVDYYGCSFGHTDFCSGIDT